MKAAPLPSLLSSKGCIESVEGNSTAMRDYVRVMSERLILWFRV